MKVLLVNAFSTNGSTGRNCQELQEYINKETQSVCYLAFSVGPKTENSYRIGSLLGKKVHAVLSRLTCMQAWFSHFSTMKLLHYINDISPDVIHLNNVHANYLNLPMLLKYANKNRIALTITLHDCWFYTGKCTHYTAVGCSKWKTGCGKCPLLKSGNASWFVDATHYIWQRKKDLYQEISKLGVIGVSEWICSEAKESILANAVLIECIYNWIDTEVFTVQEPDENIKKRLGLENKAIIMGVASNWGESKGLSGYYTLAEELGDNYKVLLVGNIPEKDKKRMPANVVHVETVSSTVEMAKYYNVANVYLNLSLEESFGKVSAEALACGVPIICIDSTANKELVGDGCGVVLHKNEMSMIVDAARSVCLHPKKYYADNCRSFACDNFSKEQQLKKHMYFYEKLVSSEEQ